MRIFSDSILSFKRRLKPSEKADYSSTLALAKQAVGNTGHSVLIIPSSSLPHGLNNNTGCGNMLNEESKIFFNFAKQYWGINYVQLLPEGVYSKRNGGYKPYSGSALDLGVQLINLNLLTTNEYGNLLTNNDVENIVKSNTKVDKDIHINIENTLDHNSATENALEKAYDELVKNNTPNKQKMLQDIEQYKSKNAEWLERKSIFYNLVKKNGTDDYTKWNNIERNLFNNDMVSAEQREALIKELKNNATYKREGELYIFKQFLAERHLSQAKKELNAKGIKLSGDLIAGCSFDETWMFPKAFYKEYSLPWGLNAINYNTPEGLEFLKLKVRNFAKRYDGMRIDASWLYSKQLLKNRNNKEVIFKEYHSEILDLIDKEIKSVKGKDFDLQNIMHEFEANPNIYSIYNDKYLKNETINRVKIYKSDFLCDGWDSVHAFKKRGWKDGTYIIGTTNHDTESLRSLYSNVSARNEQIKELSKILNIPEKELSSYSKFTQTKFAEPIRSRHNMIFFSDALNIYENYCVAKTAEDAYRLKVPHNYQDSYFKSLEKGEGFNIMDSIQKIFEVEGLDKTDKKLYRKICKYNRILRKTETKLSCNKILVIAASAILALLITTVLIYRLHINSAQECK